MEKHRACDWGTRMSFNNNDDVVQLADLSGVDSLVRRLGIIKNFDISSRTAAVRTIFAAVANRSRCVALSA
jgi:hypothetical protein